MKIKLMLNPAEISEVQRLASADFQSPTQWISKVLVAHLQELRRIARESAEREENPSEYGRSAPDRLLSAGDRANIESVVDKYAPKPSEKTWQR